MVRRIQEIIFHKIIAKMSYIEKLMKGEIQDFRTARELIQGLL